MLLLMNLKVLGWLKPKMTTTSNNRNLCMSGRRFNCILNSVWRGSIRSSWRGSREPRVLQEATEKAWRPSDVPLSFPRLELISASRGRDTLPGVRRSGSTERVDFGGTAKLLLFFTKSLLEDSEQLRRNLSGVSMKSQRTNTLLMIPWSWLTAFSKIPLPAAMTCFSYYYSV